MARAQRVQQRAVALIKEQDPIDFMRRAEIGGEPGPKSAHVRMEQAERPGLSSLQVHFRHLFDSGHVCPEDIFDRTKQFQAAPFRGRQDRRHDVHIAMVRRARLLEHCVPVELRVRRGVIAAVKGFRVRLRLAVIGKRMARNLPSAQAAAVREGRQKNRVHRPALLEDVEHLFCSLVNK